MRPQTSLALPVLLLVLVCTSVFGQGASAHVPGYHAVQMVRGPQNHLLFSARVNGKPAMFLVDTGADISFFRADRAQQYGLIPAGESAYRRGRSFPLASANDVAAGAATLTGAKFALTDASQFRGTAPGQHAADGVIGLDLLRRYGAIINCHTRQLFLKTDPAARMNLPATTGALGFTQLSIDETQGGISVPCTLLGRRGKLIVDTGAFVTGLDDDALRSRGIPTRPSKLTSRGFDGQIRPIELAQIDDLRIGGLAIAPQTLAVMDLYGKRKQRRTHTGLGRIEYYTPRAPAEQILGVLGNELLDQRRAIIDLSGMSLFLK